MHWLTWIGIIFITFSTAFTITGQQKINDKSNQSLQRKSDKITACGGIVITCLTSTDPNVIFLSQIFELIKNEDSYGS